MKILIAEDDAISRLMLQRTLQSWGHEVIVATNGEEAWERFLAEACRFVITDWMMPQTDGLELCRRIRALEGHDYTYVILLTAKAQKDDLVEGMSAGADDFIVKPFDNSELEVRIWAGERVLRLEHSLNERNKQIQAINERLKRWGEREHALNQVTRALSESLELGEVLRSAVIYLQELFSASRAFVMLPEADGQSLCVAGEHCLPGVEPFGTRSFPWEQTVDGQEGAAHGLRVAYDLERELEKRPSELGEILAREFNVRSLISAPILHQGRWLGEVGLHQCDEARRWAGDDISLLYAIAQQMAIVIVNAQLYSQVQELAVRDGLTGLYNRRYFDQALRHELERARRFGHVLSLVMVDLDHLKQINDQFGHQAGDAAIREIGEVLSRQSRRIDIAARYGGEEFAVILIEAQSHGAYAAANAWRETIRQRVIVGGKRLTASFGVATYPLHAASAEELIKVADEALYCAKRAGRDCIRLAEEPKQSMVVTSEE
jgi:diguanylate cyclase (GGDEF)-like protein